MKLLLVNPGTPERPVRWRCMYPYSLLFLGSYLLRQGFKDWRILDLGQRGGKK